MCDLRQKRVFILLVVLCLLVGFFVGRATSSLGADTLNIKKINLHNSGLAFINPLLAIKLSEKSKNKDLEATQRKIESVRTQALASDDAVRVSVYFHDLETGQWTGVEENDGFAPASLFKIPVMIAALKRVEDEPAFLTTGVKVVDGGDPTLESQDIPPTQRIEWERVYTVDELIKYMIVYSDNRAAAALIKIIGTEQFDEVLTDLGLDPKAKDDATYTITPKDFSLLFRVLYNATYLNHEMSSKALTLLTEVEFSNGLRAHVPTTVAIAHKFGEFGLTKNNEPSGHELHDCGIFYTTEHPYFLCVMTSGAEVPRLEKTIAAISDAVYASVSSSGR